MKKVLQILLLFIFSIKFYAQLDREHWFAPMFDGQSNTGYFQYLYLSTNETTPFTVYVYNNNVIVYQAVISKGSPKSINITNRNYIITTLTSDLNKVGTKGFYAKGDRPFFASLRFGMTNHAEIITSKGTAGIGNKFYTVSVPNSYEDTSEVTGFSASFLATEDNTTVTVNNFKKNLTFNGYGNASSFTFVLNKGQSYIIDGRSNNPNNKDGFIGATVTADKPISMSNGSFNGQFSTLATNNSNSGTDIYMDQSVPVDKLGDEFVIVKGYGAIGNKMEGAVIVATESNTQIYLNDSTTPIATLANPGEYYPVEETNYVDRGNTHYNLHIKTSKNVYVYQMMGGVESSGGNNNPLATGGMNYIPPLNCYLPKKIDEIGSINVIGNNIYTTKLNIITEKGAIVTVNGAIPNSLYGPYDTSSITANQKWVSYSIPNQTGNITVVSDKAVTAGLSGGSASSGYGGYFAGFSSTPLVLKIEGDCIPGVKLAVTEGFDSYQWLIKDNSGSYVPAPGINNTYIYEPPQAGIYAVKIKQGSCPEIQTADFKFYNCTTYTNVNYDTCSTIDITPAFSLSTQTLNPTTVKIDTPPTNGTVVIGTNGVIKYTANPGFSGVDTFRFSYCGNGTIPDCETTQATIQVNQIVGQDATLRECTSTNSAVYNLSQADVTSDTTTTKVYYKSLSGAQNETTADEISNFTAFNSPDTNVYVRIKNATGCFAIFKIELKHKANPVVQENFYTKVHCDDEDGVVDGNYVVNPNDITPIVLSNPATFTVKYYDSAAKANAGGTDNITGNYIFTAANAKIWIRVESVEACATVREITLNIGNKIPLITNNLNADVCDKGLDNTEIVNLADYLPQLTSETGLTVLYYASMADALSGQNAISASQTVTLGTVATFYYVIKNASFCSDVATVNLTLIEGGIASTTLQPSYTICEDSTILLDAGTAHSTYNWYNQNDPTTIIGTNPKITLPVGKYFVILISTTGCEYKQSVEIVGAPKPVLNIAAYNATLCDDNLDGQIDLTFSTNVTPTILTNNNTYFTVTYYNNPAMLPTQVLPDAWSFSADTRVYVKVASSNCTDVTGFIDFKIGSKVVLLTESVNQNICDTDSNGDENIDLNDYKNLFLSAADMGIQPTFYLTLSDAQNNTNAIAANVVLTANINYYYRFETSGSCANVGELKIAFTNGFSSTTLQPSYTICENATTELDAGTAHASYNWYNEAAPSTIIGTTAKITVPPGKYYVILTSADGCDYKQNVEVVGSPVAQLDVTKLPSTYCDDNIDGTINLQLSTGVTPLILLNNNSVFTVNYYNNVTGQLLPDNWSFTTDTVVRVEVISTHCGTVTGILNFKIGAKVPLITSAATESVCDDDLDGEKLVQNLDDYIANFTSDPAVTAKFYTKKADAQANASNNITEITVNQSQTLFVRLSSPTECPEIAELTIKIKVPLSSTSLLPVYTICPDATISLDAGSGFSSYAWYNESDPTTIIGSTSVIPDLPVGKYFVILTGFSPNDCPYTQKVEIKAVELPIIEGIAITGNTVIVTATGGNAPYKYALDGGSYQDSNTFTNVAPGLHTAYVISDDNCTPVNKDFSVIEIYNLISPNGDGKNDVLDMSLLKYKENVTFQIVDRQGKKLFEGDTKNNYIWDGKQNGKVLPTSSYWYIMQWQDFVDSPPVKYTGWILLKNRNSD